MEKTTDMEEASMVVPPWRGHRGGGTGSGRTSGGGHEELRSQGIGTEPPEIEEHTEMEKTTDLEEASMVVPPWRWHSGGSTGSGSTSGGDHEELRGQGHKRRLEEPKKSFLRLTKCQGCELRIPAQWLMRCPRCNIPCGGSTEGTGDSAGQDQPMEPANATALPIQARTPARRRVQPRGTVSEVCQALPA